MSAKPSVRRRDLLCFLFVYVSVIRLLRLSTASAEGSRGRIGRTLFVFRSGSLRRRAKFEIAVAPVIMTSSKMTLGGKMAHESTGFGCDGAEDNFDTTRNKNTLRSKGERERSEWTWHE